MTNSEKLESFLLDLYQRHLDVDQIGKEDNFFILGGDSIRATQIANELQSLIPSLSIDVVTIFEHSSVTELHQFLIAGLDRGTLQECCHSLK